MTAIEVVEVSTVDTVAATVVSTETVEIGIAGPQGPTGATGPEGPQGDPGTPGSAPQSYVHTQAVPSATWTVVHNLGFPPNVTVIDSSNRVVVGEVEYPDINTVVLTFSGGFAGKAYLS